MTAKVKNKLSKNPLDLVLEYLETEEYQDLFSFFAEKLEHLEQADTDMILSFCAMLGNFGYYEKLGQTFEFLDKHSYLKKISYENKIKSAYLHCTKLHLEAGDNQLAIDCLKKLKSINNQEDLDIALNLAKIFLAADQPANGSSELDKGSFMIQKQEDKNQAFYFLLKGIFSFELESKNDAMIFWEKAKKSDYTKSWSPLLEELEQLAAPN